MFEPIREEKFDAYHAAFQGEVWDVCSRCGGKCEAKRLGALMPGEAEYLAKKMGMDAGEFRDAYLDGVETKYGLVDVTKMKLRCPLLGADGSCSIKDFKIVLCDTYPIMFEVKDDSVEYYLDDWCPLTRDYHETAAYFRTKGIEALARIGAPLDWHRAVEIIDSVFVDYDKLWALRADNPDYFILSFDEVLTCRAEDSPPPTID